MIITRNGRPWLLAISQGAWTIGQINPGLRARHLDLVNAIVRQVRTMLADPEISAGRATAGYRLTRHEDEIELWLDPEMVWTRLKGPGDGTTES